MKAANKALLPICAKPQPASPTQAQTAGVQPLCVVYLYCFFDFDVRDGFEFRC